MKRLWRSMSPVRKATFLVSLAIMLLSIVAPPMAHADDCLRDPLNAADCMRTPGYRQTITIIFSSLPALASILPNLMGGSQTTPSTGDRPPKDQQPDEPPTIHYAVQVDKQSVILTPDQGAGLALKAWKSVDGGPWTPAPEVQLAISISPDTPDVTVTPRAGVGEMHVNLAASQQATPGMRSLTITGIAPAARTSAQVQVEVQTSQYELRVSADQIEISVGDSVELEISAWQRGADGMMVEAPEARIRPWLPSERDFFEWSPPPPYTKGGNELYGRAVMRITAVNARQESELCYLDFTAIFPDRTEINKRVEITLKMASYRVIFV